MFIIATDLDRTLLPNGNQEYDGSMKIFNDIIKKEKLKLIYATGRSLKLVKDAMREYHIPVPDYLIAEIGTRMYFKEKSKLVEDKKWIKIVNSVTPNWNIELFKEELSIVKGLRIQEKNKQNKFKLSYYIDNLKDSDKIVRAVTKIIKASCSEEAAIKACCSEATVVYSIDETHNIGLLDIIPKYATKVEAVEYLRKKLKLEKQDIVYCGDSGNDILPLTFGYKSILVRNAIEEVRNAVKEISIQKDILDNLYMSTGYKSLNGYYVSGVIEGLIQFNVISPKYIE